MSEIKHTPGPWRIDDGDEGVFGIFDSNGQAIAYLSENPYKGGGLPGWDVDQANARLIAAAPELLAALKTLPLEAFDKEMDACDAAEFVDNANDFFEAMQKARSAIAKAEVDHE